PAVKDFEESTATIMLQGDEASDELDELEGIFTSAIECADEDPDRALALLRGTIHESDRMLRHSDTAGQAMDARFYLIYGSALHCLTEVSSEDDAPTFRELARQRLAQADALCAEGDTELLARVRLAQAKVELAMLAAEEATGAPLEALDRAVAVLPRLPHEEGDDMSDYDDEEELKREQQRIDGTLAVTDLVLSLVESQRVDSATAGELIGWCEAQTRNLLVETADSDRRHALGHVLHLRASALLEGGDFDDEARDDARELLEEAQDLLGNAESAAVLLLRGEIELNLGNVMETKDDQEQLYAEAVATFKRVQAMGELPDEYAQLVEEMDAPASSGDGYDSD
ncbi:hypothetical protein IWQ57_006783, partial [Coemansia nantahalensis]